MKNPKRLTLVRMTIPNSAAVQAYLSETPASLTLLTPNAAVQVQIETIPATDREPLTEPRIAG